MFGDFYSTLSGLLTHGSTTGIMAGKVTNCSQNCSLWAEANPITVSIERGADLGTLSGPTTFRVTDATLPSLVLNGRQPCPGTNDTVTIVATSGCLTHRFNVRVLPSDNLFTHFGLMLSKDTLMTCETTTITGIALDSSGNEAYLDCTEQVRLSMSVTGLGGFTGPTEESPSDTLMVSYDDLRSGRVHYAANNYDPSGDIIIQIIATDANKTGAVLLRRAEKLNHFDVTISPDTISLCSAGIVSAIPKNAAGDEVSFSCDTLLVSLAGNARFIGPAGDTAQSSLEGIPFGDVRRGNILVIPEMETDSLPASTGHYGEVLTETAPFGQKYLRTTQGNGSITVTVQKQGQPAKSGSATAPVANAELTISLDHEEVLPARAGSSTADVVVYAKVSGNPTPGIAIKLGEDPELKSGGHDHESATKKRPPGTFSPKNGVTGSDGSFHATYKASEFSGTVNLVASSPCAPGKASAKLDIKVPGLEHIPLSIYYKLVGGRAEHQGPEPYPQVDHNHWAVPSVITGLAEFATWYAARCPPVIMQINDLSLPWGGRFDIEGGWTGSHGSHKFGRTADIGLKRAGHPAGIPLEDLSDLKGYLNKVSRPKAIIELHPTPKNPTHFHIEFAAQ